MEVVGYGCVKSKRRVFLHKSRTSSSTWRTKWTPSAPNPRCVSWCRAVAKDGALCQASFLFSSSLLRGLFSIYYPLSNYLLWRRTKRSDFKSPCSRACLSAFCCYLQQRPPLILSEVKPFYFNASLLPSKPSKTISAEQAELDFLRNFFLRPQPICSAK